MRGGAVVISGGSHPLDEREIAQLKRQLTEAEADRQSLEQRLQRLVDAAEALLDVERRRSPATEDSSIWLEAHAAALGELVTAVDARRALSDDTGETSTVGVMARTGPDVPHAVVGDEQCLKQNNFGRTCILARHGDEQECRFPARGGAA
jgi:hypothetical protein